MQTIAVLSGARPGGPARPRRRALPRPLRAAPGGRAGTRLRDLLEPEGVAIPRPPHRHRRALFGPDQCRPAAGRRARARHRARSAPARADAYAPVRAGERRRGSGGGGRGAQPRLRHGGQGDHRAHGLCRPARALHALVGAALGREPRQGRQGLAAGGGDRAGRPALAAAALPRRAEGQAVHGAHRRGGRAGPGDRRRSSRGAPASRALPGAASATSSPRKAAPPPTRWRRTAARPGACMSSASTSAPSASS